MWTVTEISEISKTLNDARVEDFLTEEEINVIQESTRDLPRSRILQPKHKKPVRFEMFGFNHIYLE